MKKPTLNGWLAIIAALVALVLAAVAAFADRDLTPAEADDLSAKTGDLIHAVQQATDDGAAAPAPTNATPANAEARP